MNRVLRLFVACGCVVASTAFFTTANAQARRAAPAAAPSTAKAAAPVDITGHWVSLITDDWVYRMITPAKGDVSYVPLNPEGRRVADAWDPARDEAAGEQCKGYAAPAIMRLPSHVEITWQDDNTLKLDIDTGMQTRLFHFGQTEPQGARSWQGWSAASWQLSGTTEQFYPGPTSLGQIKRAGNLKVDTTNLRAGYLRKNGVPYSERATFTEHWDVHSLPNGDKYLVNTNVVDDPVYLQAPFQTAIHYKFERDTSKWDATPCDARF